MSNSETFSDLISLLKNSNSTNRAALLEKIGELMQLQDALDESVLVAIPVFMTLLNEVEDDEKNHILSILSILIRDSKEVMHASDKRKLHRLASQIYELLCEGAPIYRAQFTNNNLDTRLLSTYILGLCGGSTVDIVSYLKMHFLNEINNNVKFVLIRSITFLHGYTYNDLEAIWGEADNTIIKYALSLAMMEISHDFSQFGLEHILRDSLLHSEIFEEPYLLVPYRGSVFADICTAVDCIHTDKAISFFINTILQWDNDKDKMTLIDLIEHLLDVSGFRKRGKREWIKRLKNGGYSVHYTIKDFDDDIRFIPFAYSNIHIHVIACIVNCEAFWKISTNLLNAYYLPTNKADLLEMIGNFQNDQL